MGTTFMLGRMWVLVEIAPFAMHEGPTWEIAIYHKKSCSNMHDAGFIMAVDR
jgi:hypothetical protein